MLPTITTAGFNSRLREEATSSAGGDMLGMLRVSTHASVRRRQQVEPAKPVVEGFQLTPP